MIIIFFYIYIIYIIVSIGSQPSTLAKKNFSIIYFGSNAKMPLDKLIVNTEEYPIKPGFKITIPKTLHIV